MLSLWTPSLPGWNLSHTEGLPRWAESVTPQSELSPARAVPPCHREAQPLPTTLPSGVPLPTQPQAATTQAGESSSMNQALSPASFTVFLTAALGRATEEETVLLGSHGWQVVAAGLGLRPLWTRPFLRPEKPSQEQDHHTPTLTCPGDLWTPGPGNSVSHAGHLWEAWEHTPAVFDPSITHHHHSELDSFLLPITGHKRGESAPCSTQASDVPGYRLTHRFPPPTS